MIESFRVLYYRAEIMNDSLNQNASRLKENYWQVKMMKQKHITMDYFLLSGFDS
jgi:hypothetical protein